MMTARTTLIIACVLAFLAVALGAFAAHALADSLSVEMKAVYETANDYHFFHALGLMFIGLFLMQCPQARVMQWAAGVMLTGVIIFSGSLYVLSVTELRWLGMITPIGGSLLLIAWVLAAVAIGTISVKQSLP